jgi:VanZ family protein
MAGMLIQLLQQRWLQRLAVLALVAYAVAVAWLSLTPVTTPAGVSDKLLHVTTYGLFMLLTAPLVVAAPIQRLWRAGAAIFFYSGVLEIGQAFVPGRYPEGLDMLANGAGVLAAGVLLALLRAVLPTARPSPLSSSADNGAL